MGRWIQTVRIVRRDGNLDYHDIGVDETETQNKYSCPLISIRGRIKLHEGDNKWSPLSGVRTRYIETHPTIPATGILHLPDRAIISAVTMTDFDPADHVSNIIKTRPNQLREADVTNQLNIRTLMGGNISNLCYIYGPVL